MDRDNGYYLLALVGGKNRFRQTYLGTNLPDTITPEFIIKKIAVPENSPHSFEEAYRLFQKEADILHKLGQHPQIPEQLDEFPKDGVFYLVQERIQGEPLASKLMEGKPWRESEVIALLEEMLDILKFFHQVSGPHLDMSPGSFIRRDSDGKLVLIDFGAARQQALSPIELGTRGYMPQNPARETPGFHTDIYAVGAIAIQALTGVSPTILHEGQSSFRWRDRAQVSDRLANILDRMVDRYFRNRYQSVNEVLNDLKHNNTLLKSSNFSFRSLIKKISKPTNYKESFLIGFTSLVLLSVALIGGFIISKLVIAFINFSSGQNHLNNQEWERAIDSYDKTLKLKPHFYEALNLRGYAYGQIQNHEQKLRDCLSSTNIQEGLEVDERDYSFQQALNCQITAQSALGKYPEARQTCERGLQTYPDNDFDFPRITFFNCAEVFYRSQKNEEDLKQALDYVNRALEKQPDYTFALTLQGKIYEKLQQFNQALKSFNTALESDPNYQPAKDGKERVESLMRQNQ